MKKITLMAALLLSVNLFAQQPPTGPAIPVNSNPPTLQQHAWYRGGNFAGAAGGNKNIFGTMWNSPVYHYANSQQRMSVGFLPTGMSLVGVGGFPNPIPANRLTRVSINRDGNAPIQRPLSLLHIGYDFPLLPQGGQRNWMDIGMMAMSGTDHIYLGLRQKSNTATGLPSTLLVNPNDKQDAILNWGDNGANDPNGPDNLCFIYTAPPSFGIPRASSNDGRELMRMIHNGNVGLGPVFSDGNQPKSNYHMHNENSLSNWLQITNETLPGVTQSNLPTGAGLVNANDGFRIGILGHQNNQRNGNALVYNQENRHLLFSTSANTNNVTPNNTQERMRVTRIGAPTNQPNGGYGGYNPANLGADVTRVSISHNPANPVTRPLSLVHLGYNTGGVGFNQNATDGWRPWMDIGTFTSNGTDNVYIGLKQEAGAFPASDRNDAVVNWGDNDGTNPLNGPDNLRFIFTSTQTATVPTNAPGNSLNGLEVARMDPRKASTLPAPNFGMMGIGDWTTAFNILPANVINAKLDIDGDLRIRQVTQDNALTQVLVIDPADHNRVHWKDITPIIGGGFGSLCGSATPLQLAGNSEVQLNNFDFHFTGIGATKQENNVGIGTQCSNPLPGKLTVRQNTTSNASTGLYVENNDDSDPTNGSSISLFALATGSDAFTGCNTVAGWFEARSSLGQNNLAICVPNGGGNVNIGFATADLTTPPTEPNVCAINMGGSGSLLSVNGSIFATGYVTAPSDINFKTNIAPITNALDKVKKLNGVYYDYQTTNYPNLNFSTDRQVGLIAQNVDTVLTEVTHYDSTLQAFTLDYSKINALLIEAIKEQDNKMDSLNNELLAQDSINTNLENRLLALENCVNDANLCNNQAKTSNTPNNEQNEGQTIELSNLNAIILDQNLPNPFAEKTSIAYSIPDDVFEAQLLFYDMSGRIIKQVDITERGDGKLTVYGENLKNGIYTYSLIADGKLIATKKMVKQ